MVDRGWSQRHVVETGPVRVDSDAELLGQDLEDLGHASSAMAPWGRGSGWLTVWVLLVAVTVRCVLGAGAEGDGLGREGIADWGRGCRDCGLCRAP